jgi:trehalose 6-phosphate synthase
VRPFPISVESWSERNVPSGDALAEQIAQLREQYKLGNTQIVVGVERIDYTKGLRERLIAFDRFLTKYPEHREKFTFVLLGAPSRTHLRRYRDLVADLESMADEINWKHQTECWKPLRFLAAHHDASTVHAFLQMSSICVVSPLHDGMNLVAKEYIAAKTEGDGVLVLSEFAGAARELGEALLINPYDTEQFADTIHEAMSMGPDERRTRMKNMQTVVEEYNVYRWAASFLTCLTSTHSRPLRKNGHTAQAGPLVVHDSSGVASQGVARHSS